MRSRFYVYVRSPLAKAEQTPLFAGEAPPAREPEYRRVRPPKFASFQSFDCAICGYPELEHPVFLSDGGNAIAVGSGCAEKLTGRKAAEWDADLAAEVLASDDDLQRAYSMFHASLPGRVTDKFIDDTVKWAGVPRQTARRAADIYKALRKVGAARKWKDRATLAKAPETPLFGPVKMNADLTKRQLVDRLGRVTTRYVRPEDDKRESAGNAAPSPAPSKPGVKVAAAFNAAGDLRLDGRGLYAGDQKVGSAFLVDKPSHIELSSIEIDPEYRGQGHARAFLEQLASMADAQGRILSLTPEGHRGASVKRLKKLYGEYGFVPNKGRRKNYEVNEAMIRNPGAR